MIRTLHLFLAKELAKVTLLALVAFTFVMTVFAIIEPLRKRGLSGDQLISLFGFTLPVMLSLTLPVAALFAATIVYGRFSQDNELMACRASGISTASLLKPALVLGTLVTVASLVLSNYVTPQLARMGEAALRSNARGIVFNEITTQGYFKANNSLIHADQVDADHDTLSGVAYLDYRKPNDIQMLTASTAFVYFDTYNGDTYATVYMESLAGKIGGFTNARETAQTVTMAVPSFTKDKAAFYNWDDLVSMLEKPEQHRSIRNSLNDIKLAIGHDRLAQEVVSTINSGKPYDRLSDRFNKLSIRAARATSKANVHDKSCIIDLSSTGTDGKRQPVEVTLTRDGIVRQIVTADSGIIDVAWSARLNTSQVSLVLRDPYGVQIVFPGEKGAAPARRKDWTMSQLAVPADIVAATSELNSEHIYDDAAGMTSSPQILATLKDLKEKVRRQLMGSFLAELHGRMAYGLSCFLLVAMGAALGLIYRGGQILSAFAISVVPAAIVIVMVLMGKELVSNPGVQRIHGMGLGLAVIWSGIVAMCIANVVIYLRLVRR